MSIENRSEVPGSILSMREVTAADGSPEVSRLCAVEVKLMEISARKIAAVALADVLCIICILYREHLAEHYEIKHPFVYCSYMIYCQYKCSNSRFG